MPLYIQFEKVKKISDERGYIVQFLRQDELKEARKKFGTIYFVTFKKRGVVRGNHFHTHKTEWFGMVSGKLQLIVENVETKERKKFIVFPEPNGYTRIRIGPQTAHAFKSLTQKAVLLNYTDVPYDSENPDSHQYILIK